MILQTGWTQTILEPFQQAPSCPMTRIECYHCHVDIDFNNYGRSKFILRAPITDHAVKLLVLVLGRTENTPFHQSLVRQLLNLSLHKRSNFRLHSCVVWRRSLTCGLILDSWQLRNLPLREHLNWLKPLRQVRRTPKIINNGSNSNLINWH